MDYPPFMRSKDIVEAKKRQQLRLNDPALRDLESKLRLAYVNKTRAAQISENEYRRQREKMEEEEELRSIREKYEREDKEENEREIQKETRDKMVYKRSLDLQIEEKNACNNLELHNFLEEKRLIDEIVLKMKKDQENQILKKLLSKKVQKELIDNFVETQKDRIEREKERLEKQNEEISRYWMEKERIDEERALQEKKKREIKNESVLQLAERLREEELEKLEKEGILAELYEGRQRDAQRLADKQEMENALRKRIEMRECNEYATQLRKRVLEAQKREEDEYRSRLIEEMEREAKIEQMNDQKRRMKQIEFRREAERFVEQRRAAKLAEKEEERMFCEELEKEEAQKNQIIEEERVKLIREHADNLLGYLPPGILRESDFDYLPSHLRRAYAQRDNPDPLRNLEKLYDL